MRLWGTDTGQTFLLPTSRGVISRIVTRLMCTWSSINLRSSYDLWPPVRELTQLFPDFEHLTAAHFLDHFQGPIPHIWIFSTSDWQHVARKSFRVNITNVPTLESRKKKSVVTWWILNGYLNLVTHTSAVTGFVHTAWKHLCRKL